MTGDGPARRPRGARPRPRPTDRPRLRRPPRRPGPSRSTTAATPRRQPPRRQPDRRCSSCAASRRPGTGRSPWPAAPPGMIGDPSGRSEERNLLDDEHARRQPGRHQGPARAPPRLLRPGRPAALVDNAAWTAPMRAARLPARRRQARHGQPDAGQGVGARPARGRGRHLLHRVQLHAAAGQRLLWLHEHEGCELQIGGSDQWGNITAGVDLIRRRPGRARPRPHLAAAARAPTAQKFGKSEPAATSGWRPERTSPYRFFQYWMQVPRRRRRALPAPADPAAGATRPRGGRRPTRGDPSAGTAQRRLAREVTTLVHGPEAAARRRGGVGGPVRRPTSTSCRRRRSSPGRRGADATAVGRRRAWPAGSSVVDLLVETGLAASGRRPPRAPAGRRLRATAQAGPGERPALGPADLLHGRYVAAAPGQAELPPGRRRGLTG